NSRDAGSRAAVRARRGAVLAARGRRRRGRMSRLVAVLSRRRGTREWDVVLRATGVLAALAIYPAIRWPGVAGLLGFLCLTLFVSGPISVVVPAAFEPM